MVNAAIIGGEQSGKTTLASKLGKKGTESDIVLYNFMKSDTSSRSSIPWDIPGPRSRW